MLSQVFTVRPWN